MSTKMVGDKTNGVEIRTVDGKVDEVIGFKNGETIFHLEMLRDDLCWMKINDVMINVLSETPLSLTAEEDV